MHGEDKVGSELDLDSDSILMQDESDLEKFSSPCSETSVIIARGERVDLVYAVQPFRRVSSKIDYYAVRLRCLGELRYVPNRKEVSNVWGNISEHSKYDDWDNAFHATVSKQKGTVKFGPRGQIKISNYEHRNHGLGSFAMSLVIRHLKKHYPEYKVRSGSLSSVDGGESNYDTRHFFYKGLGLEPNYKNDRGDGKFSTDTVSSLRENINTDKIFEVGIDGLFSLYVSNVEEFCEVKKHNRGLKAENKRLWNNLLPARDRTIFRLKVALGCAVAALIAVLYFAVGG